MPGITGEDAPAEKQARAPVGERAVDCEVVGVGLLPLLVSAADPGRRIVELAGVEPGREPDVVPEPSADQAVHADPKLAPGRRNDARLDLIAKDAIVSRRLVGLVEDAERDEEQPAFDVDLVAELVVEPGLLDFGLAVVSGADHGVLDLDLRVKSEPLIETMVEAEHKARQVGRGVAALAKLAVSRFAVTSETGAAVTEAHGPVERRTVVP